MTTIPSQANIAHCETIIGYTFHDKRLCCEALKMSGNTIPWPNGPAIANTNSRLAVLGDLRVKAELCRRWCADTTTPRGTWDAEISQSVATNDNYSRVGREHGLDECVILNPGTTVVSPKSMATTVEAVLGAVYLDGGEGALQNIMARLGLDHPLLRVRKEGG